MKKLQINITDEDLDKLYTCAALTGRRSASEYVTALVDSHLEWVNDNVYGSMERTKGLLTSILELDKEASILVCSLKEIAEEKIKKINEVYNDARNKSKNENKEARSEV